MLVVASMVLVLPQLKDMLLSAIINMKQCQLRYSI